jgi:two-component system cell cycle response regulator DivK
VAPAESRGDRCLVLIVDDDADQREMYGRYLTARGFPVLLATHGGEAVELARQTRPDAIVMDLWMPHVDGWEATRRLKRDPSTRNIPVIACTGHVVGTSAERAFDAGCDAYVTKPCLPKDLVLEIRRVLTRPTTLH